MFSQKQIQQLAELIIEAGIDVNNPDEVSEYLGILLEDIAGCECISDSEIAALLLKVELLLKTMKSD